MRNTARLPPPVGPPPDPNTDGTVMQFTVVDSASVPPKPVPTNLGQQVPPLTPDRPRRLLIQNVERDDQGRVLQAELDGQLFHELTTELPTIGSTEDWNFINTDAARPQQARPPDPVPGDRSPHLRRRALPGGLEGGRTATRRSTIRR